MKKMIITILFILLVMVCKAPEWKTLYIVRTEVIKPFDPILYSFQKIESNFRTDIVNRLGYTGILQLGQEMVDEANRICKKAGNPIRYSFPESALDSAQSVQIWYIVQDYWNPGYELKRACKIWNPLASKRYYKKIRKELSLVKT